MSLHLLAQNGGDNLFTAEKLTLVGVLVAVIWAIMTRRLVPGQFYEDLKRENDELRRALDKWRETGREVTGAADELTESSQQRRRPGSARNPKAP